MNDLWLNQLGEVGLIILATGYLVKVILQAVNDIRAKKGASERRCGTGSEADGCPLNRVNPETNMIEWYAWKKEIHEFMEKILKMKGHS